MTAVCLIDTSIFVEVPDLETVRSWLPEFPDSAMRAQGLGDLSIVHDWNRLCERYPRRRVYIWSLDQHLSGYVRGERGQA